MRRFLVIEGLIGVGKTTLCRLLEKERGAQLFLEPAATNPFLEPFYADPARYAFPVQMFYLMNRWKQQSQIRQLDLYQNLVISDYIWEKDRLFAEKTLDEEEMDLYDRFASALGERAPSPDLIIYLEAPLEVILKRINKRQAPGEMAIGREYLEDLKDRYERLWAHWSHCPVLRLDNTDLNYAEDPSDQRRLLDKIDSFLIGDEKPALGSDPDREAQTSLFSPPETKGA